MTIEEKPELNEESEMILINTCVQPIRRDTFSVEDAFIRHASHIESSLFRLNESSNEHEEIEQTAFTLAREGKIEELREFRRKQTHYNFGTLINSESED